MTEDEVREIVREELWVAAAEQRAVSVAAADQHRAEWLQDLQPEDGDGPATARIKAILRGDARTEGSE